MAEFAFSAVNILMQAQRTGGGQGTIASKVDPGFMKVLEISNIDPDDFFKGLEEAAEQGITKELPPGQVHSLKDLMVPALFRVGLITDRVRGKYEEAGIPINEDLGTLNAMEDAKSDKNVLNQTGAAY